MQHHGKIMTPNYPDNYGHNEHCVWKIIAPGGKGIHLSFDSFHLQTGSVCNRDYVELRDGLDNTAPLLGRYCGSTRPATVYVASGSLQITFKSDDSQFYRGFEARFSDSLSPPGEFIETNTVEPIRRVTRKLFTLNNILLTLNNILLN